MKQVLIKNGEVDVEKVPAPVVDDNGVLVETAYSLISGGTELAGLERSGESLFQKAFKDPQKIKKAFDYLKDKGVKKTLGTIEDKVGGVSSTGYSCSGIVIQTGKSVQGINPGDKVACAGSGKANHAEVVLVPKNLVTKVPKGCNLKDAASVTLGSIAMQGVRRADVRLGEKVGIIGLGLIGQITNQLLKSAGCRTIGFDLEEERVNLAEELGLDRGIVSGIEDPVKAAENFSGAHGVDATIITASAPEDNSIVQQAMKITRKKGKVVVVGNVDLDFDRQPFYEKEIDLLISCSYGPGRYDEAYEEKGLDYPYPYIRWTENRNMQEYLEMIADKKIDIDSLVDDTFVLEKASASYESLKRENERPLSVMLDYNLDVSDTSTKKPETSITISSSGDKKGKQHVALIGAGNFAKSYHLPNLQKLDDKFSIRAVISGTGSNAKQTAKKFNADYCGTDYGEVLEDETVDVVFITTRHNLHAEMTVKALRAGKHVFVEKPLALSQSELDEITNVYQEENAERSQPLILAVGFNRRFSPAARKAKEILKGRNNPILVNYRVNAGYIPLDHWVQTEEGGGRAIGEACHMFDLFNYLVEEEVASIDVSSITPETDQFVSTDNFDATLKYTDGSVCSLTYTALGSNDLNKERVEVHTDMKSLVIDDYKSLEIFGSKSRGWSGSQDKGHVNELREFYSCVNSGGELPIDLGALVNTTEVSFIIDKMVRQGDSVQ